ncbi:MAG TPA: bifunctional phosphoribosylaminoimidazolecarboxamide formyltransferase/IMP cyclohydrolase [Actinomycetota bacterium]|nr:bifunctional phosphoribosylaminoimidazolecarboxamide formyltransferase/IMP cyclohydrolase [Actinomycetota bacterium]
MTDRIAIRRALISVWDKTGVVELAAALSEQGTALVSSGGTATTLREAGLHVQDVSDLTGFPEMLDGRVKTLHPAVHGAILADRSKPDHMSTISAHGIEPIDLVVVNLYPFDRQVSEDTPEAEAVSLIDVGGPTMVRAAAKNFASVGVVVDPDDYERVAEEAAAGGLTLSTRRRLAGKAFSRLSAYDAAVSTWFADHEPLPEQLTLSARRVQSLRYGENPHQQAALYSLSGDPRGIASGRQLQGKEMSYINYLDADAVLRIAGAFREPAAVIVKHTNPCGVAVAEDIAEAYRLAFECDPRAAFGGIVGLNRVCTADTAAHMQDAWSSSPFFLECVVAPGFDEGALGILSAKKNLRVIELPADLWRPDPAKVASVSGGLLVQTDDPLSETREDMRIVTEREPSEAEWDDLLFAWTVCAHVKSNAIVLANLRQAVGVGAGQMSRVESMEIAVRRAGDRAKGSVAASEALFPFGDSIEAAAAAGITAIIQPGGSMRDQEVIDAADANEIAMVFTGVRHFLH